MHGYPYVQLSLSPKWRATHKKHNLPHILLKKIASEFILIVVILYSFFSVIPVIEDILSRIIEFLALLIVDIITTRDDMAYVYPQVKHFVSSFCTHFYKANRCRTLFIPPEKYISPHPHATPPFFYGPQVSRGCCNSFWKYLPPCRRKFGGACWPL